ncbi:HugZ family heme oxygenase [Helicobacter didelphidarum]|uniref:HugZ family heme oxygenase n=1 Tax=Helicobacter didelphidarum TaxID=2040648 RepID=A0A3D8IKA9_9HELI|nr:HugZ family heme oxygenase [Helicobacter didelphidarum]RDU65001.1 HugZ family heme oxygenase [Helicobacter didelphidarum]
MSLETIKTHMNEHHANNLKDLVLKYAKFEPKEVMLENVTKDGLFIKADGKEVFAPFPQVTEEKDYKNAIIALCQSATQHNDDKKNEKIVEEIEMFKNEFESVLLASLSRDNKPHISYSPLLRYADRYFLYISEVAQHCGNLKANPDKVQIIFIEDESKTKTIIARKRLTYDAHVKFLPRDDFFDKVYDNFEKRVENINKSGGVSTIRGMTDFHLVEIDFQEGRFVKGFGSAYQIDKHGKVSHIGGGKGGMPHTMPHGHTKKH